MHVALLIAALLAIQCTGALAATCLFPDRSAGERWLWGGGIGLAATLYLAVLASYVRLELVAVLWPAAIAALVFRWRFARPRAALLPSSIDWRLAAILAAVAAPRAVVALVHTLPPGWDPTFHLVLARKILETHKTIHDWTPFEDVALDYPVGSHTVVAVLAMTSRLPLQTVFNLLVPIAGVWTTAQMFLLGRAATGRDEIGLYTAVAYGLWANWGGIDYYRWGGLPNELGMLFFAGLLTLLCERSIRRPAALLIGGFASVIVLTHHHVLVTAGVILAVLFVWDVARRNTARWRALAAGAGMAAVLTAPYLVTYALQVRTLGQTSVLSTEQQLLNSVLLPSVGVVLAPAALVGALVALARRALRPSAPLTIAALVFAGLFLLFEYAVPAISERWTGDRYVALAPSRFLTDFVYPASAFAGIAVFWAGARLHARATLLVAISIALGAAEYPRWRAMYVIPTVDPAIWDAYQWIQTNTPRDTIVLDSGRWSVFGTWRRTAVTSLPASEPSPDGTAKHALLDALESGVRPADETAEVVAIRLPDATDGAPVLWRGSSGLAVVELWPARNK